MTAQCLWKRGLLSRKRSDWCLLNIGAGSCHCPAYGQGGGLCGCGQRTPPTVKKRRRIVRRRLARQLREEVDS